VSPPSSTSRRQSRAPARGRGRAPGIRRGSDPRAAGRDSRPSHGQLWPAPGHATAGYSSSGPATGYSSSGPAAGAPEASACRRPRDRGDGVEEQREARKRRTRLVGAARCCLVVGHGAPLPVHGDRSDWRAERGAGVAEGVGRRVRRDE